VQQDASLSPTVSPPADRPLATAPAAFWIGWFSFREMVRRRRLIFLGLMMLVPVLVPLAWRIWDTEGLISAELLLTNLGRLLYIHVLIAVAALAVGISAIGEQVEDGTILYYWTRPLSRAAIYSGRLLAAQMVAGVLLVGSMVLCFIVMVTGNFGILSLKFLGLYLGTCTVIVIGAFVYTAIFALLGTALRRPIVPAIVFAFGWESISGNVPLRLKQLTVVFHLRNLIRYAEPEIGGEPSFLRDIKRAIFPETLVPEWQSYLALLGTLIVVTVLGIWILRRKEIFR
jgi:ABC-type transport system involved in multi-copper enzyme maturation permease subunit